MQHYINYGYGFPSSILTKEEFQRIKNLNQHTDQGLYSLGCVPFTEGDYEHDWCCIVLYSLGQVNSEAKMLTISEIKSLSHKHSIISEKQKAKFLELLETAKLEKYIDQVEMVFYSDNY